MPMSQLQPPVAPVREHTVSSPHGERLDPYYWLRDDERTNPEVLAYLSAENAYHAQHLAPVKPLEDQIYTEIVARLFIHPNDWFRLAQNAFDIDACRSAVRSDLADRAFLDAFTSPILSVGFWNIDAVSPNILGLYRQDS